MTTIVTEQELGKGSADQCTARTGGGRASTPNRRARAPLLRRHDPAAHRGGNQGARLPGRDVHRWANRPARHLRRGPDVWEIVEPYLLADRDWTALRESFPQLDERTLRTALEYFERFPEEIEARIALNQAS